MSSAKKLSAKQIFNKPTINRRPQPKSKQSTEVQIVVKNKKVKKKQEIIDDRLQIATSSLNIKFINKNQIQEFPCEQTKKENSTVIQKQNTQHKAMQNTALIQQKQDNQVSNKEPKHIDNKTAKQQKPTSKSRAKIFKEQLIDTIPLHNKTSLHRWTYGQGVTSSKLIIGNWNVNGIRSIISKKMVYPYLHTNKPDIFCVTQTKADEKNFDSAPISFNGYHGYWNFPKHSSGYSGVAVFSKFLPKSVTEDMLERQHSQQGRILTLQFQKFMLINIYVPTVGKDLQRIQYRKRYDSAFRQHVNRVRTNNPGKPVFIVGDLNVAHTELDTHPGKQIMLTPSFTTIQRQGLTQLLNMGYADVFRALHPEKRAYTWWYVNIGGRDRLDTPGLGRRIDYFLLPCECMKWVKRCDILREFYGADHCPVEMQLDMQL